MNKRQALFERGRNLIASFFEKKSKSVVGIDIGSSSIKVVQLRKSHGRAILETYGELSLGPYAGLSVGQATNLPEEKLSEALLDIIREANVTTHNGAFSIPLASSLVVVIEIPTVVGGNLEEMVSIEARRYVPVPISEVALEWRIIPEETSNESEEEELPTNGVLSPKSTSTKRTYSKVLIAAIHNETISKYQAIAQKSAIDASFIEIETFSSMRSLLGMEQGTVLILDIGAGATKLSIIERGVIAKTHIINRGSQDMTISLSQSHGVDIAKAETIKREVGLSKELVHQGHSETMNLVISSIFTEANSTIFDYEKKRHRVIDKVILSGGGSLLFGILEIAKKNFETQVVYADPFSKIDSPAFLEPVLKMAGPNFAVATGVAFRKLQELE